MDTYVMFTLVMESAINLRGSTIIRGDNVARTPKENVDCGFLLNSFQHIFLFYS